MAARARILVWAATLKRDVVALWIAARDRRTPLAARLVAGAAAAYALSPLDLIPDFIPVLGYLDDLLIVPACLWLAARLIPAPLMAEYRALAARHERPRSRAAALVIVFLWAGAGAAAFVLFLRWLRL